MRSNFVERSDKITGCTYRVKYVICNGASSKAAKGKPGCGKTAQKAQERIEHLLQNKCLNLVWKKKKKNRVIRSGTFCVLCISALRFFGGVGSHYGTVQ